ncbi:ethylbenzene dehydrogenase-related protein [Halobaculum litoreum]|uniref:Ethylbenzene dehydrogenase-related protein n=1 Tax=Halobaculum litoreum TaxID=3031998 RepID=A0ABD5XRB9_9EURY
MDRSAATRATAITVCVVVLLLVVQTAIGSALVRGTQPMAVRDEVATEPTAAAWGVPARSLELSAQQMAQPYGGGSVSGMEVQAMTNETHVAFRLSWNDPTRDANISAPTAYSDAVALMLHGGEQPPITMGAMGTPVNIWYWRASWQFGNHTGTGDWTGDMYSYPHPNETTKPGLAAGNPSRRASTSASARTTTRKGTAP